MAQSSPPAANLDDSWSGLERLVEDVAQFSKAAISEHEFFSRTLARTIESLDAVEGAAWRTAQSGQPELVCHVQSPHASSEVVADRRQAIRPSVADVLSGGESCVVQPTMPADASGEATKMQQYVFVLCPIEHGSGVVRAVHLCRSADSASTDACQRDLRCLEAICELAADFLTHDQLRQLSIRVQRQHQLERFRQALHASLSIDEVAYTIANDGRQLVGCDRVHVLQVTRGRKCSVLATSGATRVDRRASVVRHLELLVETILAAGEDLHYRGSANALAPETDRALKLYLDISHARALETSTLRMRDRHDDEDPDVVGVLVAESFTKQRPADEDSISLAEVADCAVPALRNATWVERLPLIGLSRRLSEWLRPIRDRTFPRMLAIGALVAVLASALCLLPVSFRIEAHGQLRPRVHRDVFAQTDGVVERLEVKHGQVVETGELLLVMSNSELDLEFSRVTGQLRTTQKQLQANRAKQWSARQSGSRDEENLLVAEFQQLEQRIVDLETQLKILQQQQESLRVTSPIKGEVLTWDIMPTLANRPVHRGEALLRVANSHGPWELDLRVSDHDIGHVLDARSSPPGALDVSFMVVTEPDVTYHGCLSNVGVSVDVDSLGQPSVPVIVDFERDQMMNPRPGARVVARIHCGKRALAYVWLRHLLDAIRTRLFV